MRFDKLANKHRGASYSTTYIRATVFEQSIDHGLSPVATQPAVMVQRQCSQCNESINQSIATGGAPIFRGQSI